MSTTPELDAEISRKEEELRHLKREREDALSMPMDERLANVMHSTICHHSHEDRCGWFYEIDNGKHNWSGATHTCYLNRARRILAKINEMGVDSRKAISLFQIFTIDNT